MAIEKTISISIDGKIYRNILDFTLEENVGLHTKFKGSLRARAIERTYGISIIESSRNFLGKPFKLMIEGDAGLLYQNLYFSGTVTNVKGKKGKEKGGLADVVVIEGMSNSVFLSGGKHTQSFLETNLSEVVSEITSPYNNVKIDIRPVDDPVLDYAVQSQKNTFEYLQYLATLYFGNPSTGLPVTLTYGQDLKDFSLGLTVKALNFNFYNHDYFSESESKISSKSATSIASGYTAFASNQSANLYNNISEQMFPSYESQTLDRRMHKAVSLQLNVEEQKQVSLYGESTNTGLSLGKVIYIKSGSESFGTYRIIQVSHSYNLKGKYKNSFTAIPIEIDVYPLTDTTKVNNGHPEIAVVTDTTDPEGMSRIKVQFSWQVANSQYSPWIRVATPYAGNDRGFHFIPEVGDSVLVGYEQGNIERPFMQAAFFTGVNKHGGWQSNNNDFKGITTKGGHIIELNDTEGSEMITITDKNSNVIRIDTANNNIELSALENMTFNAKNIEINAEEEININVGTNMSTRVAENVTLNAKYVTEMLEEDKTLVAKEILVNGEKVRVESSKENMELVSSKMVDIQASDKVKLF